MDIDSYTDFEEKRIFHIDDECYIIYLGSDREDYKPFLRIGNSKKIDQKIIANIYSIVVTDAYTGDPSIESQNIDPKNLQDIRYVGEKKTIEKFLNFLAHFNIETNKISQYQDIKNEINNAMLYMYDNGNITLSYDKSVIFDLNKREKQDQHFIEKSNWIKTQSTKNPLRYLPSHLDQPGFLKLKNSLMVFGKGDILSFGLPDNYFESFTSTGIDPDLLSTIVTDEVNGNFLNLCKRKRYLNEPLQVLTGNRNLLKSSLDLFTVGKQKPLMSKLEDLKESQSKKILDYTLQKTAGGFTLKHTTLPTPLVLTDGASVKETKAFVIDRRARILLPQGRKKGEALHLAEGIPHLFSQKPPVKEDLLNTYFYDMLPFFEGFPGATESSILNHLKLCIDDIAGQRNVQESTGKLRKVIGSSKTVSESHLVFLFNNVREICAYYNSTGEKNKNEGFMKSVVNFKAYLDRTLASGRKYEDHLPLIADCLTNQEIYFIFYRLVKSSASYRELTMAQDSISGIKVSTSGSLALFDEELNRLSNLIGSLAVSGRARKKLLKQQARQKAEGKKEKAVQTQEVEQKKTSLNLVRQAPGHKRKKSLTTILLVIAGVVIVLAAVLLFTPFSPLKKFGEREETVIAGEKGADSTRPEGREKGPGTNGGEEALTDETSLDESSRETMIAESLIPEEERARLESFLTSGPVPITILDVFKMTNIIAVTNGYHRLDSVEQLGKDPDWIFPANLFILPDKAEYTVVKGDTIWYIAGRFIKKNLEIDWKRYLTIVEEIEKKDTSLDRKRQLIAELETLKMNSYSENFVKELEKKIQEII
jgi:hypothetical protein